MDTTPDLLVRDAYLAERDAVVDVSVGDGEIIEIGPDLGAAAQTELDADGDLVSPGLVDAHVHLDMALSACGDRRPHNNDGNSEMEDHLEQTAAYFADTPPERIASNGLTVGNRAVANGVLHVRTHAYVDSAVGTEVTEAVDSVREALDDRLDVEIVAFPQQGIRRDDGSKAAVREALASGADLVGGLDPATLNGDREGTVATWFDIATDEGVDIDVHLHERGETGLETLDCLASVTRDRAYGGRVAASHAFALADAATSGNGDGDGRLATIADRFDAAGMATVTCYQSTPIGMPIRRFHDAGLTVAHGTDQAHDLWGAHGNVDPLEAMLVESLKLPSYSTNDGLACLWDLITRHGARLLGIDGYRIEPGTPADLVVHDAASPQWAIVENRTPRYCVKDGRVVAEGGRIVA